MLIRILNDEIREKIEEFIHIHHINDVGFVPPAIRREVESMKVLQTGLKINLPVINILKIGGIIPVPQKSLSKRVSESVMLIILLCCVEISLLRDYYS